ncbi:5-bromo-4-chloroindolyl phosphate hydrolysis family protein [Thiofilum flexile]|uniref:5-bromo-4-chloroindolyl phosphate hydrolysis family protein n=1 Tax=Thiofilum flexile TaxID=125627 RepID=UPI00036DB3FF|nr:5-bromo-4-chloroindolyl phosphate hydrolysis family protein [Thiofilum flexile]
MSKAQRYTPTAHDVRYGIKGILLYLLPIPSLISALISLSGGQVTQTLVSGGAFAAYMIAASIARQGFKLEGEYEKRKLARAPKTPYKTIAALIISITTGLLAWLSTGYGIAAAILFAVAALLGFALYYGLDPRRDKNAFSSLSVSLDEVLNALEAAEVKIKAIDTARTGITNPDYRNRLQNITQQARDILTTIEDDPTRLSQARKFLKVYLDGTQRVAETYAKTAKAGATPLALDTDFGKVLDSIEQTFAEQKTKLLENNTFDLDVQIEVLNQQLKRETVI